MTCAACSGEAPSNKADIAAGFFAAAASCASEGDVKAANVDMVVIIMDPKIPNNVFFIECSLLIYHLSASRNVLILEFHTKHDAGFVVGG